MLAPFGRLEGQGERWWILPQMAGSLVGIVGGRCVQEPCVQFYTVHCTV